ncbi:MAG: SDR family oxidoreductase [Magnetococcales bacterium]|nr:SDR family oxidoreductase [Magnetococcales bacterium]
MVGFLGRVLKIGIGVFLASPFIVLLTPLWFIHRWLEIRAGRPAPESPLDIIRQARRPRGLRWEEGEPTQDAPVAPPSEPSSMPVAVAASIQEVAAAGRGELPTAIPPGSVALVTGGGGRLGALLCRDLAELGFAVAVAWHSNQGGAEAVVRDIQATGGRAEACAMNLTNPALISAPLNRIRNELGSPTLLINNAALFFPTPRDGGTWEAMDALFKVNLQGPLWLALKVAEGMTAGGQIINIADLWGRRPLGGHAAYGAAKAGLIAATRGLARDLAPRVRVNAIAPGAILAPADAAGAAAFRQMQARTPLSEQAGPVAVLRAVRYLVGADYVTGEVLAVDGGRGLV